MTEKDCMNRSSNFMCSPTKNRQGEHLSENKYPIKRRLNFICCRLFQSDRKHICCCRQQESLQTSRNATNSLLLFASFKRISSVSSARCRHLSAQLCLLFNPSRRADPIPFLYNLAIGSNGEGATRRAANNLVKISHRSLEPFIP